MKVYVMPKIDSYLNIFNVASNITSCNIKNVFAIYNICQKNIFKNTIIQLSPHNVIIYIPLYSFDLKTGRKDICFIWVRD